MILLQINLPVELLVHVAFQQRAFLYNHRSNCFITVQTLARQLAPILHTCTMRRYVR